MKSGKLVLHHSCVVFAPWARAESWSVQIAVGQRGNVPKEPPLSPGWLGGKCFHQFLPTHRRKPKGSYTGGANSGPNHNGLWIFLVLADSRCVVSLGAPAPVVLMIVGLFDGEWLFIHEQNSLPVQRCDATKTRQHRSSRTGLLLAVKSWTLCGDDCALSAASRTVTGVAEILESFDGPPDI